MRGLVAVSIVFAVAACSSGGLTTTPPAVDQVTEAPAVEEPLPPEEVEGLGVITFGTSFDDETLLIDKPKTKFKRNVKSIAWSAQFNEVAGATSITLVIARVSEGGSERLMESVDVAISNPEFDLIANEADLASIVGNKAGKYVLRYLRESTLLAEGQFQLVKL